MVGQLSPVDVSGGDVECCTQLLHDLSRVIAWAEAGKVDVARRLAALAAQIPAVFPEQVVATATRVSLSEALTPFKRGAALDALPVFGDALAGGSLSVAHVDVLATAVAKLEDPAERDRFVARGQFLAGVAERSTPGEFARTVRNELVRCRQGDGLDRLQRQRRATYLKTWVDQITGMWCLRGEFDPETGARIHNRLTRTIEKLFHDTTPDTAPTDPLDKQHHLRALALVALVDGTGARPAATDMSILIDATTLATGIHNATVIDCGLPIELPIDTIRKMACVADITPIIVGADGVRLYVGRTTGLASTAQRRALRAMYRTCAIPGCTVGWDNVIIHHVNYFHHGGPTNIDNLLPVCTKHHHCAHEGHWQLTLDTNRTLTIRQPDGTTMCHDPPKALAA